MVAAPAQRHHGGVEEFAHRLATLVAQRSARGLVLQRRRGTPGRRTGVASRRPSREALCDEVPWDRPFVGTRGRLDCPLSDAVRSRPLRHRRSGFGSPRRDRLSARNGRVLHGEVVTGPTDAAGPVLGMLGTVDPGIYSTTSVSTRGLVDLRPRPARGGLPGPRRRLSGRRPGGLPGPLLVAARLLASRRSPACRRNPSLHTAATASSWRSRRKWLT